MFCSDKLKEAISKGAALVNEFQSYRLLDMHPWRGNRGDNGNQDENRNPRKNPLEYSLGKSVFHFDSGNNYLIIKIALR